MKILKSVTAGLVAAGITALSGIGQPAHAQQAPAPTRTVAVHYGDLDLASPAGRDALGHRISQAVRAACGTASPADLRGQNLAAACRRDLLTSLRDQREAGIAAARPANAPAVLLARR
jgi:UrcA family protein